MALHANWSILKESEKRACVRASIDMKGLNMGGISNSPTPMTPNRKSFETDANCIITGMKRILEWLLQHRLFFLAAFGRCTGRRRVNGRCCSKRTPFTQRIKTDDLNVLYAYSILPSCIYIRNELTGSVTLLIALAYQIPSIIKRWMLGTMPNIAAFALAPTAKSFEID